MKPVREMSVGEFGAFVASHLRKNGIDVVLTGGTCVTIYSNNRYQSFDLDFIEMPGSNRKRIKAILEEIGFQEGNRYFTHPDTEYFVEFPAGPLSVGDEPIREIAVLEYSTGRLRIISPTECVKDRLAAYFHWRDLQCLEQAILVASMNDVDLEEVERWSEHEGMLEEFNRIRGRLTPE
jgi:hypothetical protein